MRIMILTCLLCFFLFACGQKEDQSKKVDNQKDTLVSEQTETPIVEDELKKELEPKEKFDINSLSQIIEGEVSYSQENVFADNYSKVDSTTVARFFASGIFDESRLTSEYEGRVYNYHANYCYYNLHQLDSIYILTIREIIEEGPEYSFIAITIDSSSNNILDSDYIFSVWTDQYQADFLIDYSEEYNFQIEYYEKYQESTLPFDTLRCLNLSYTWTVNNNGMLERTLGDSLSYNCALLDYEKGLVDDRGIRENCLYVLLPHFDIKMPQFYPAEYPISEPYSDLLEDKSHLIGDVDVTYNIWGYGGLSGSPFENELHIIPTGTEFTVKNVQQKYATTLYFNEDGSGGVYTIPEVGVYESEWAYLENFDEYSYGTLDIEGMSRYKDQIHDSDMEAAGNYINSQEIPTTYEELVSFACLKIDYEVKGKPYTVTLNFEFEYGD